MYKLKFAKRTDKQIKIVKKNSKLYQRLLEILKDISIDPYSPAFKFERLKHDKSGKMSKRLTDKDRVFYRVVEDKIYIQEVDILSILDHYSDN